MQYGAHAFLWIDDWTTDKGNQAINAAAAGGFDFLEIPLLRPHEVDPAAHAQVLRDAGIGATASLVLPAHAHMPDRPKEALDFLIVAMEALTAIGGTYLCGCLAYHLGHLTGQPPTEAEKQVVIETLGEAAREAETRGITLGLEVCNRYETYVLNTVADGAEMIRQIGAPNLQLHADTYHMNIEEEGFHDPLVAVADVLGYIHMSESHRGMVGTGTVTWDDVFQGLADANYTGPLVLESFAAINPDLAAATCLWRAPRHTPEEMATEGLRYLRERAAAVGMA